MIRREFLRLLGALPFVGLPTSRSKKQEVKPFHAVTTHFGNGFFWPLPSCHCGHRIEVPAECLDGDILICSECWNCVQIHVRQELVNIRTMLNIA